MIVYLKHIILFVSFCSCIVLTIKANNGNNDSIVNYKNEIEVGIGGAANIFKTSYVRNIYLNEKWIVAPRIGLSTLGVDIKFALNEKLSLVLGERIVALLFIPIGKPIPFDKKYYSEFGETLLEPSSIYNILGNSLSLGLNYSINRIVIGTNISLNSFLIYNRENYRANDVLSFGVSFGYKFNSFKK